MTEETVQPPPVECRVPCIECGFMQDPDAAPPIRLRCSMCCPPDGEPFPEEA